MRMLEIAGRAVALVERGEGGVPLLLLHGYTGSKEDFAPVLDALAADRRVVALDLPGHGGSLGPDDPGAYGLAASARWVLEAADTLGLGEFHLLGHSMGGLVAQRVASAASQRLVSLVLASTGLGALREEVAEVAVRAAVAARDEGLGAAFDAHQTAMVEAGLDPRPVPGGLTEAELRDRFRRLHPAAVVGGARALVTAMPLGAFLRGIDVPVLVVHGERDWAWTPPEQALLARSVRGARLAVVPDAVHSPQMENPRAWLAAVTPFLAAADAAAGAAAHDDGLTGARQGGADAATVRVAVR